MTLYFTTTKEAARLNGVKILVYSKAGYGKTTLCKTAPRPLIISNEAGLLPLGKLNIPVIEIKTLPELYEAYTWITSSKEANNFDTLCFDSLTEMAEVMLSVEKTSVRDIRQAYGELIDKMTLLIKLFRDLKEKNIYFSAKEIATKDEFTGKITYGPSMPGKKLGSSLPYLFDEVFNLAINTTPEGVQYRYLLTTPTYQYEAKDRSGCLASMEKPDLTHIINKIRS